MTIDVKAPEVQAAIKEAVEAQLSGAIDEATKGLKSKNNELISEIRTLKKGREIDPAQVEKLEQQIEQLTGDLTAAQKAAKDATKLAEASNKKLESEFAFTTKLLVDNGLTDALVKAGVKASFLPAVKALLAGQVKIVTEGDARKAMVGDKELSAHITEWAQTEQGKEFVIAANNTGGGAGGGGSGAGGAKSMNRASFEALDPAGRMSFVKGGGKVTD